MTTKHSYSYLVWLGAGTAKEPQGLTEKAGQLVLIEAREDACQQLQKNYPHARVLQQVLASEAGTTEFTQYNLAEYSAIQPPTGIKQLFPGLKPLAAKPVTAVAVSNSLRQLQLQGADHCLIIDLPDISLPLLTSLAQDNLLNQFNTIYIKAGAEPLYKNSATTEDVQTFMQAHGYLSSQNSFGDPDIPWLQFSLNPLWNTLLHAQQEVISKQQSFEKANSELIDLRQTLEQQIAQQKQLEAAKRQQESIVLNLKKEIEEKEKKNLALAESEKKLQQKLSEQEYRNTNLNQEVSKLAAQIELITNVVLKEKAF